MLTKRKERILQERINLKDFRSFLDEYCKYHTYYKNCQFLRTHTFEIENSRLEFVVRCPNDDDSIREIILMKKNEMWYEKCDHVLVMMHNTIDNDEGKWDWSWQIVDYSISKHINIDKNDIFKNVLEFILKYSKGEESIRIKREYKLGKLNI